MSSDSSCFVSTTRELEGSRAVGEVAVLVAERYSKCIRTLELSPRQRAKLSDGTEAHRAAEIRIPCAFLLSRNSLSFGDTHRISEVRKALSDPPTPIPAHPSCAH